MVSVNITFTNAVQLSHNALFTRLAQIELWVFLAMVGIAILIVCGTARRRRRGTIFNFTVWAAYVLSTQILTYAIGLMHTAQFRNELFALWAIFLLILYGSSDSFSAFTLEDNEQWSKYTAEVIIQSLWVGSFVGLYAFNPQSHFKWNILVLFACLLYKVEERDQAFRMASKSSIARNTKLIADFMASEHGISIRDELDPNYMCRYNYLVAGDVPTLYTVKRPLYHHHLLITDEVITIKKIWRCQGRLLSPTGDPDNRLKDLCLSFALYRLLCRRFGGYPFAECNLEKTWNLIRYGLLSKEEDYERAFRVVEEELSFLFDLFYTKYAVIFKEGGYKLLKSRASDLAYFSIGCLVAINILRDYKPSHDDFNLFTPDGRINIDKLLTGVVIIGICIMEIIQLILIMVSNWSKVMWICRKSRKLENVSRDATQKVKTHAQHLAEGGEFITHLWALLSHAGILKQDQTQTVAA
ncbi:hypothetical protein CCACVL1_15468 [Corchorus capsularis]|uniref:DUF4220 domain-containing protein n=1 Tax=Corchorus capsularis TaxID=210143 RepID=A0A1R3I2I9_COCAP|nr:hypothetical protein CCACVL1_15468 [Corchorus capsularis]